MSESMVYGNMTLFDAPRLSFPAFSICEGVLLDEDHRV